FHTARQACGRRQRRDELGSGPGEQLTCSDQHGRAVAPGGVATPAHNLHGAGAGTFTSAEIEPSVAPWVIVKGALDAPHCSQRRALSPLFVAELGGPAVLPVRVGSHPRYT